MTGPDQAQILAIVRASPVRARTAGLLESIVLSGRRALVRVVVLSRRRPGAAPEFGDEDVEEVPADADLLGQVQRLAQGLGMPMAGPAVVRRSLPARRLRGHRGVRRGPGPDGRRAVPGDPGTAGRWSSARTPFRVDYFALLSGFNYIAPGATFIDIGRYLSEGGLDPRYPSAGIYEYLLRIGAGHGLDSCPSPLLETEAVPFPGIAPEWVASYGGEALAMILTYNRSFLTPGSALGLGAVLADQLAPFRHKGFYDKRLVSLVAAGAGSFRQRYLEQLGVREPPVAVRPVVTSTPRGTAAGPT